jgi:16S rRNA (uracil1498-N3)-methyltransferase
MHRFFIDPIALRGEDVVLTAEIVRHLGVLRLAAGAEILLLDGSGILCQCRITRLDRKSGAAVVLRRTTQTEATFPIELLQALPKGDKMDLVLQKGTELGINRFVPLQTDRSIPRLPTGREEQRHERWLRIIREAARQCRRPCLPELGALSTLEEALANCQSELRLMLWEEGSQPLEAVLRREVPAGAAVLIGPEGGFSEKEAATARRYGFVPVLFGPRILRSETAGFAAATILQYRYGDLGGKHAR